MGNLVASEQLGGDELSGVSSTPFAAAMVDHRLDLGPVSLKVRTSNHDFPGSRFITRSPTSSIGNEPRPIPQYVAEFNEVENGATLAPQLQAIADKGYRGRRFLQGYYITDHFGSPVVMQRRSPKEYAFWGTGVDRLFWPFLIKHLLTIHSLEADALHLKAAVMGYGNDGILLFGRGGSGKTVLLSSLCDAGVCSFVSNTHTLITGDGVAVGVRSTMRVRPDSLFGARIERLNLPPAIVSGEYVLDPFMDTGWDTKPSVQIKRIFLMDFQGGGSDLVERLNDKAAMSLLDQFALATNVYGLKEDLLDHVGSVSAFANAMSDMRRRLRTLVSNVPVCRVGADVLSDRGASAVRRVLDAG